MTGEVIAGRYRLLEPLGRGAMSSVWRAHDDELDRDVAIKVLAPTADRTRFEREARAVAALSHPNICNLYDYGESDGKLYMVLEYLAGGTLEDRLKEGKPLPDADTERYATEIAAGLAHAHDHGVVHRDLKPANVLFDSEGRAKIADFGIARMGDMGTLTEAGTVLGTAAYISPEQASGEPATAASDIYSTGVILFRMLTGRLPFLATSAMELVRMNRDDQPPAVTDVRADAPPLLAATTDAALAKDPAERPPDGAALLAALRDDTAATVMLPAVAPMAARRRQLSLLPALIVLGLVLLLGGAALALALGGIGGSNGNGSPATGPSITLPKVPTVSTSTGDTSTQARSTVASTTQPTTSTNATTTQHTTTAHTTTAHTTTAHTTTRATTTQPTTTFYTTTYGTTTTPTTDTTFTDTTTTATPDQATTTATGP